MQFTIPNSFPFSLSNAQMEALLTVAIYPATQVKAVAGAGKSYMAHACAHLAVSNGYGVESFPFAVKQMSEEQTRFAGLGNQVCTANFHKRGLSQMGRIRIDNKKLQSLAGAFDFGEYEQLVVELTSKAKLMSVGITNSLFAHTVKDVIEKYGPDTEDSAENSSDTTPFDLELAIHRLIQASDECKIMMDMEDLLRFPLICRKSTNYQDCLIILDECQDYSPLAADWFFRCNTFTNSKFLLVGDDEQSLMSFAGADSGVWNKMAEKLSAHLVAMSECRRCSKSVVNACGYPTIITAMPDAPEGQVGNITWSHLLVSPEITNGQNVIISETNAALIRAAISFKKAGLEVQFDNLEKVKDAIFKSCIMRPGNHLWQSKNQQGRYEYKTAIGFIASTIRQGWAERSYKPTANQVDVVDCVALLEKYTLETGLAVAKPVWRRNYGKSTLIHPILLALETLMGESGTLLVTGHRAKGREWRSVFYLPASGKTRKKQWEIAQYKCVSNVIRTRAKLDFWTIQTEIPNDDTLADAFETA